jgi:hypothetical protein
MATAIFFINENEDTISSVEKDGQLQRQVVKKVFQEGCYV